MNKSRINAVKGCRRDDALYRSTVLPGVLKADQRSHDEKCVNWNEAVIRELLTIRAEAEIILQFSEMVRGALYMSHEMSRVFTGSLRVRKITGSVNEPKSNDPGMIPGTHYPCIFQNLCVKEALDFSLGLGLSLVCETGGKYTRFFTEKLL